MMITTNGVDRRGWSWPTSDGIWRFVASEYARRESPSIAEFASATSVATASTATT